MWSALWSGMFSSEHHRRSLDEETRRLARVLPAPPSVYRPPLHWPAHLPPPANGVPTAARTSGSRDDLATPMPPAAKPARDLVDQLDRPSTVAGKHKWSYGTEVVIVIWRVAASTPRTNRSNVYSPKTFRLNGANIKRFAHSYIPEVKWRHRICDPKAIAILWV